MLTPARAGHVKAGRFSAATVRGSALTRPSTMAAIYYRAAA